MAYFKIITVKAGYPVITGDVREVCGEAAVNNARQAYADAGVNVVARAATVAEYATYSHGGHVVAVAG